MDNIPLVYLCSADLNQDIKELEGYVCDHNFDEENNVVYYYSSSSYRRGEEEIILTDEYLLEYTSVDYGLVKKQLFGQGLSQVEQENYIEAKIEHPLIRYRARKEVEYISKQEKNEKVDINFNSHFFRQEELVGAKILLTVNPQYHKTPLITQTNQYLQQDRFKQVKPLEQVANYLDLIKDKQDLLRDKTQLYSGLIVKPENIPQTYFENQSKISEQQGKGKINITPQYKQEMSSILVKDQKLSLDSWLEYLNQEYPVWYQTYILDGLKNMGAYNKEKNRFSKRRKDYIGAFPELNREVLAKVYDYLTKYHEGELNIEKLEKELLNLLKTGSFVRLYEYFLVNVKGIIEWDKQVIEGKWVKYKQTDDKKVGKQLAQSLEGYNTGWCTAGIGTAQSQLSDGDFYVYYSKNKLGFETAPRVAIRMEEDSVAEIRGIEPNQNLESIMTNVMKEKIKQLPGGEEYFVKTEHMEQLTDICNKHRDKQEINVNELRFLYELDHEIQGFGYGKDPRIKELINKRNMKKDLTLVTGLKEEEICIDEQLIVKQVSDIKKIKYVHGELWLDQSIKEEIILPNNFIAKTLTIVTDKIKYLPKNLKVKTLDIYSNSIINKIPQDIQALNINIKNNTLFSLPDNLVVDELIIRNVSLKELPKGLKAKRIIAANSHIEIIPQDIQVEELYCSFTKVKELPDNLEVDFITLDNTPLQFIPQGLKTKFLRISNTNVSSLPNNLKVDNLNISNTNISILPNDLKADSLDIYGTQIEELPQALQILETLKLNGKIKSLPDGLNVRDLILHGNYNIKYLPEDIQFKNLYANNSGLIKIPDHIRQLENLELNNTKINTLPDNLEVETLRVSNSSLWCLPSGLKVKQLEIDSCPIDILPYDLEAEEVVVTDGQLENQDDLPEGVKKLQLIIEETFRA